MKLILDNLVNFTGWSAGGSGFLYSVNQIKEFIAGDQPSSLIFGFEGVGDYVEKEYADINLTNYDELIFWTKSINKGADKSYTCPADFSYSIIINGTEEFYFKTVQDFYYVKVDLTGIDILESVRIKYHGSGQDYLILSYMLAAKETLPYDIFVGIQEQLETNRDLYHERRLVGTASGTAGDSQITFSSYPSFVQPHCVIEIDDGVNSEIHNIMDMVDLVSTFGELFEGQVLSYTYTLANVYLYYPVRFGVHDQEILLPSINIWGFIPTQESLCTDLNEVVETVKGDGSFKIRRQGHFSNFDILIDCESEDGFEILGELSFLVRQFIAQGFFWVNGRKMFLKSSGPPTELFPTEAYDIVPKIQYPAIVSVREDFFLAEEVAPTTVIDVDVDIED